MPVASPLKLLLKTTQVLSEARNENSAFPKGEEEVGAAIKDDLKWTELSAQDCFNQKGLRTKFLCFCSCFFGFLTMEQLPEVTLLIFKSNKSCVLYPLGWE